MNELLNDYYRFKYPKWINVLWRSVINTRIEKKKSKQNQIHTTKSLFTKVSWDQDMTLQPTLMISLALLKRVQTNTYFLKKRIVFSNNIKKINQLNATIPPHNCQALFREYTTNYGRYAQYIQHCVWKPRELRIAGENVEAQIWQSSFVLWISHSTNDNLRERESNKIFNSGVVFCC